MAAIWRKSAGFWNLEVHDGTTPPERFGRFCGLVSKWQGKPKEDTVPSWAAFDIPDFRGWYGKLLMIERPASEARFKLFGSELVPLFGRDFTRRKLDEAFLAGYGAQAVLVRTHLSVVTSEHGIGLCRLDFGFAGKSYWQADVLSLPLISQVTGADLALSAFEPRSALKPAG